MLFGFSAILLLDFVFLLAAITCFSMSERSNVGFYLLLALYTIGWFALGGSWSVLMANLPLVFYGILSYTFLGFVWSFIKWFSFTHNSKNIAMQKTAWTTFDKTWVTLYPTQLDKMTAFLKDDANPLNFRSKANLFRIHSWVIYWPLSVVATFLGDFVAETIKYLINSLGKIYDYISGGDRNLT